MEFTKPRSSAKTADLSTIRGRREALRTKLATLDEQAKAAEQAAHDAGRPVLIAALDHIKIAAMDKSDAKAIAAAVAKHGGQFIAQHLSSISNPASADPD